MSFAPTEKCFPLEGTKKGQIDIVQAFFLIFFFLHILNHTCYGGGGDSDFYHSCSTGHGKLLNFLDFFKNSILQNKIKKEFHNSFYLVIRKTFAEVSEKLS